MCRKVCVRGGDEERAGIGRRRGRRGRRGGEGGRLGGGEMMGGDNRKDRSW